MELIIVPIFFAIAFVFSMLGMGGSQLYIPILFWLGMDFKTEAIPLGMLLNVVNTASASVTYGLRGMIAWHVAVPFGLAMVLFAPLGALLNVALPTSALILFFAAFTATAAVLMLRGRGSASSESIRNKRGLVLGLGGGSALGFVAGLIGRGGGSFVVPLLHLAGIEARVAAATSAFVVTCSGMSSLVSHLLLEARPVWHIWMLSALAVLAGSQLGSRFMLARMDPAQVRRLFGIVLLTVSALLVLRDVLGVLQ